MATNSWPASLPQYVLQDGFQETFPMGVVRTSMDAGPANQRRRFSAAVMPIAVTMLLDINQRATLLDFWTNTLGMGASRFNWTHPITGAQVEARIIGDKPPTIVSSDGVHFRASFTVEIMP